MIQSLAGRQLDGLPLDNISVLRLDQLGGAAPGNKSFKLRLHLRRAQARGVTRILSFGGGWSNHLHALAAVGSELGLQTIGVVRGGDTDTAMLEDVRRWGMQLVPVSREDYRRRDQADYQRQLAARFGPCLVIPEGGAGSAGLLGSRAIADLARVPWQWSRVVVAVGSGTTLAGLAAGLENARELVGISALKGASDLESRVTAMLAGAGQQARLPWHIDHDWHCGGFARADERLRQFIPAFAAATGIPLEPVYTGKLFLALYHKLASGEWRADEPLLAIHSGGLQGRRGYAWLTTTDVAD
ncbi:1-aminocyclopropane-1-carboxylate deaminase/D-cysteine desulfhydrase [Haliea sp. E17]|uniref:1-aminocyclopropane-1-carboxylate deaminase/D-cysteine desulfhydrase n=1 Tax=Haliea sp. E17 TaxID=3401576 RepID=UPI003AAAD301